MRSTVVGQLALLKRRRRCTHGNNLAKLAVKRGQLIDAFSGKDDVRCPLLVLGRASIPPSELANGRRRRPASARSPHQGDDPAHHEGARRTWAGPCRHERRKAVFLQLRRRLKGERAEGFRENDLRDRLGQQDAHRDSWSLRPDGRLPVALRQGEHALAGARRQQLRRDQPPRSRDLHAGPVCLCSSPTRSRTWTR